jgi:hypothetical protein
MSHRVALAALVATAMASAPALAYRPPTRVLLQKAMDKQIERGAKSLRVEADVQLYDAGGAPRGLPTAERTIFQSPGNMRRELDTPEGARVDIRADDKLLIKASGQPDKSQRAPVDLLFDQVTTAPPLDDVRGVERLLRDIKALGVNPEVVTFARFDGRVCYLIGSKAWEQDKPQVWLDKETLLIARVVMIAKGADGKPARTDVRYLGWGSPVGGNWFPATIEVWQDDKIVRRSITRNVERNIPVDATQLQLR